MTGRPPSNQIRNNRLAFHYTDQIERHCLGNGAACECKCNQAVQPITRATQDAETMQQPRGVHFDDAILRVASRTQRPSFRLRQVS
jgi:hypothetical protein